MEKFLRFSDYVLIVRVLDTDGFGAEIDELSLQLTCTGFIDNGECHSSIISFSTDEESGNNDEV